MKKIIVKILIILKNVKPKIVSKVQFIIKIFHLNFFSSTYSEIFATVIIASLTFTSAQIFVEGSCPNVNATNNFTIDRFLGKWFEISAFPYFYSVGSSCVTWSFDHLENGTLSLMTFQHRLGVDEYSSAKCEFVRPGVILVSYPYSVIPRTDSNYYVLGTDYENYAVLFSCSNTLIFNAQNAWILSRKSVLEESLLEEAKSYLIVEEISTSFLVSTSQNCGASAISSS